MQLIKSALVSGGGKIAESFLLSLAVVEDLNVLLNIPHRLLPGSVTPMEGQFGFQGAPEAFNRGVVITVAPSAYGMEDCILNCCKSFRYSLEQYWLPRSE